MANDDERASDPNRLWTDQELASVHAAIDYVIAQHEPDILKRPGNLQINQAYESLQAVVAAQNQVTVRARGQGPRQRIGASDLQGIWSRGSRR